MRKLFLVIFSLCPVIALFSCSHPLPEGMGSNHEIVVITDTSERQLFEEQLRRIFERKVQTPQIEKIFSLDFQKPKDFDFYCKWKNLLLLSSLQSKGLTAQLIKSLLSPLALREVEEGSAYLFIKKDVWAKEQMLLVLTARDNQTLKEKLQEHGTEIFKIAEDVLNQKIKSWLYAKGEQRKAERRLWEKFGWTVRLPSGYKIERESTDSGFVWIRKHNPERWLFIHWESPGQEAETIEAADKRYWVNRRNQISQLCYSGDRVVPALTKVNKTTFGGREAVKLEGLWENREKLVGGPFRTWFFTDPSSARSFMIDIALFAPAFNKEPYLRQLEIIAHTFSTVSPSR